MAQPPNIILHDYQEYAKDFMLNQPYCGLFLKMGLGKTLITLKALYELNPTGHVLIIAPKPIARCVWQNEIDKWQLPFRTKSLIVNERGKKLTKAKREKLYDEIPTAPPTIYYINREIIPKLVERFPKDKWCFPIVIIDESQSFKSPTSARFKALKSVRPYIFRVTLLTGSPAPNSLEDLWSQIYLLDMGQRLGHTITQYRNTYFHPTAIINNHPVAYELNHGASDVIHNTISDIVISMKSNLKLQPITYNDITVEMDADTMAKYKAFMKTFVLDLQNGEQVDAANAAVLSAKLSQMASGAIYTNTDTHAYEIIHEAKPEMCEYIINNTDDNVLIAYHYKSDLDMLLNYFKNVNIKAVVFDGSPEMQAKWNQKEIPVMLLQPASCGCGLNLQDGGATLIWYTMYWSLEQYEQTNARIYRQGQTSPVVIHHLITRHTIDEKVLRALTKKDISQTALIEAIQAEINTII